MIFPGIEAYDMEKFLALVTVLECFVLFVHLSEADSAIGIVFKVDLFWIFFGTIHPASEPICELFVENPVGRLGNSDWRGFDVVEYFIILGDLGNDKEDVLARFLFHPEIDAGAA